MTEQSTKTKAEATADATTTELGRKLAGKYLTFLLSSEEYGLEILRVREIVKVMHITTLPRMPEHVKGVVNLRGKVVPVVDLRLKFGLDEAEYNEETCIIVVAVSTETGIIVDTVQEVLDIHADQIEPPPTFDSSVNTKFILGIGKAGERVEILLDIGRILGGEEKAMIEMPAKDRIRVAGIGKQAESMKDK